MNIKVLKWYGRADPPIDDNGNSDERWIPTIEDNMREYAFPIYNTGEDWFLGFLLLKGNRIIFGYYRLIWAIEMEPPEHFDAFKTQNSKTFAIKNIFDPPDHFKRYLP